MASNSSVHPTRAYLTHRDPLTFTEAVTIIERAVNRALPGQYRPFEKVAVLMMYWDNDKRGSKPLQERLGAIFQSQFHYTVEHFAIPARPSTSTPSWHLMECLNTFRHTHEGPNNLLIYVYSGHASSGTSRSECLLQSGIFPQRRRTGLGHDSVSRKDGAQSIDWLSYRVVADNTEARTLFLFDCCFAATSKVRNAETESEYLAASAMDIRATGRKSNRLIHRFTELLREFEGRPMTIATYHAHLVSRMNSPDHRLDNVPLHIQPKTYGSIVLAPLTDTMVEGPLETKPVSSTGRVLISIQLECDDAVPNVKELEEYLLARMGSNGPEIKVARLFNANPILLLLTLPTDVWDLMGENENMDFVSHVDGGENLLFAQT